MPCGNASSLPNSLGETAAYAALDHQVIPVLPFLRAEDGVHGGNHRRFDGAAPLVADEHHAPPSVTRLFASAGSPG